MAEKKHEHKTKKKKNRQSLKDDFHHSDEPVKKKKRKKSSNRTVAKKKTNGQATENKKKDKSPTRKKKIATQSQLVTEPTSNNKAKAMLSMIGNVLFYLMLVVILAGAIFFNFNDNPKKNLFGFRFMSVITDSMKKVEGVPFKDGFASGSIIFVKSIPDARELKKNDIITFYPSRTNKESYLTHRIVKINPSNLKKDKPFITTKGDANDGEDVPIYEDQLVGKVVYAIPQAGNILDFIRQNIVLITVLVAILFAVLVTLKYYIRI